MKKISHFLAGKNITFTFLTIALCILIITGAFLFYIFEEKSIRLQKEDEITSIAELKIKQITQWLKERWGNAAIISESHLFIKDVIYLLANRNDSAIRNDIIQKLILIKTYFDFESIYLVTTEGGLILSTDNSFSKIDSHTMTKVKDAVISKKTEINDLYYSSTHNAIHYNIITPLIYNRNIAIAVLIFQSNLKDYLYPLIQEWPVPSRSSETLLVRKDGDSVLFLNELRFKKNTALKLRLPLTETKVPAVQAVLGYRGIHEGVDYTNKEVLSFIGPIPGTAWFMVAKIEKSELYDELYSRIIYIISFTILLLIVAGIGLKLRNSIAQKNIFQKAEEEIRRQEIRLRSTMDSLLEGCQIIGFDWRYIYLNNIAVRHSRKKREDLLNNKFTELWPGIEITELFRAIKLCMEERIQSTMENEFVFPDKTCGWFDLNIQPAPEGVLILSIDITERRKTEELRILAHRRIRQFIDSNIVGVVIASADGKIIETNDYYLNVIGYTRSDFEAGKVNWRSITPPEWFPADENAIKELRNSGKCTPYEKEYFHRDGRRVAVYLVNALLPGPGEQMAAFVLDITERKNTEMALQKTKLQLQLFIEHAPAAIAMFDNEMKYIAASARFLEDYNLGNIDVIGKSHYELFPEIPDRIKEVHRRCLAGAIERNEEDLFLRSDGRTDWIRWEVRPWDEDSGKIGGIILFTEVITARKEAEESLRKSEEQLRHAAEAANFGTYSYNFETDNIYFSPEHLALYGLPPDATIELDADLTVKAMHPEDKPAFLSAMKKANNPGEENPGMLDIEFRIRMADGELRWLKAMGRTIFDKTDRAIRADGIVQDISERKKSEEKIKKLNRIYAVLSEINKVIVRTTDHQKLFEESCRIAVETGEFAFCWIGIIDPKHDRVTPAAQHGQYRSAEKYLDTIKISLSAEKPEGRGPTGTAGREGKYNICNDIENDERMLPWREETLRLGFRSSSAFPLITSGSVYGVIVFYSQQIEFFDEKEIRLLEELSFDISYCIEMLNQEKQKQKAEKERDRFFNYSVDMMCIIGFDGYFKQLNPAWEKTLGWTDEELMTKPFIKIVHPEDRKSTLEVGQRLIIKEHTTSNFLNRIICRDGRYKWLAWNLVTIPEDDNIFAVARDITDIIENEMALKSLEEQLVQAQKLESLGTMAGGIAHDFNNILNIIMGYASILNIGDSKDNDLQKDIEIILDASRRGADLVKQLLTFARKSETIFQTIQINDTIKEIEKFLKETFPKTIEIRCELQENLPSITGDATQIHQIFLNLCVNARDAMQNSGYLTITTGQPDSETVKIKNMEIEPAKYIEVKVQDTGTGIDETVRQKIFDPFFTTKGKEKGTGLGLALVYSIVKNHGGFIDLTSEVGKGTTFYIYLPAQTIHEEVYVETVKSDENISKGTGTILLIEDEKQTSELLTTLLVLKGYKVITAYDGLQGITAYQNHMSEIDAVISDIGLPKLGGEELYKQIKAIKHDVKIIIISGSIDPGVKARLQELGARYFIHKPYLPDEVLRTLKQILEEKS